MSQSHCVTTGGWAYLYVGDRMALLQGPMLARMPMHVHMQHALAAMPAHIHHMAMVITLNFALHHNLKKFCHIYC